MKGRSTILFLLALNITLILFSPSISFGIDNSCRILALDMNNPWDNEALSALGISYTLMSPQDFETVNLGQFDVLYVGSAFEDGNVTIPSQEALDALNTRAADIRTFIMNGGGVFALSEPIGTGTWEWTPLPVIGSGPYHYDYVNLQNPDHPVNMNLTSSLLSGWGISWHNFFESFDSSLTVLATDPWHGSAVSLAGTLGSGKMVFTGMDPDFHIIWTDEPGASILLSNSLSWLCKPSIITVAIDIKPGSFPNSINLKSNGNVPVAVLSSATFNAMTVNPGTVIFAGASPLSIGGSPEDVNGDGLFDLVLHFRTQNLNLQYGDKEACLTGNTYEGKKFKGCDSIRIINK